nr:retrovirus-related Pol polyprotein from transposon TNT 1-94 [Tanacetum cinerariifolium]
MAKAFKLNYSTPTNNNQRVHQTQGIGRLLNRNVGNQVAQNPRIQNDGNQNQIRNGIQLQAEEYDLMAAVNANCILMANLQQASSSGTQTDSTPVYDSDGSAEANANGLNIFIGFDSNAMGLNPLVSTLNGHFVVSIRRSGILLGHYFILREGRYKISAGLDLTYAPSTITKQQPTEDNIPIPTNSSSHATNIPIPSQDVDEVNQNAITVEPKNVKEAINDPAWIESMQEDLLQFKRMDVWVLVPTPDNISPLTLKWKFKNKHDEEQTVIRNKSRLVVRGYRQEEGLDFEESFAQLLEWKLSGYAWHMLHINLSPCFIDADHPSHVYKLKKALYGLKQAPRAWYDELSTFLLQNNFFKGTIDPTLFIRRFHDDILVIQAKPTEKHLKEYQAKPTEKHLKEVKRIFCYLWRTVNMGLWYTKDSGFKLTGFSDVDYARCKDAFN